MRRKTRFTKFRLWAAANGKGETALAKARAVYKEFFGWEWPEDDGYLRELAKEVHRAGEDEEALIWTMRETDDTSAAA